MQSFHGYALIDPVSRNDTRNLELNIINPLSLPTSRTYIRTYVLASFSPSKIHLSLFPSVYPHVPLAREQEEVGMSGEETVERRREEEEEEKKEHGRTLGIDA